MKKNLLKLSKIFLVILLGLATGISQAMISSAQVNAMVQDSNGKIVTADGAIVSGTQEFLVCRYNANGSLDSTFGSTSNGLELLTIGQGAVAKAIGLQSTGAIIAAGYAGVSGSTQFTVVRLTTAGLLDGTFGSGGLVTQLIDSGAAAYGLAVQSNDAIVVAGVAISSGNPVFALMRLTSTGALDTTFGSGTGIVTTPIGSTASGQAVAIQSNGKIVVAGFAIVSGVQQFALARYNTNGSPDTSFGTSGIVTTDATGIGASSSAYSVTLDASQNIVVGGIANGSFAVARYTSTGALDGTFGTGGIVTDSFGNNSQVNSVLIEASGDIIAVGSADTNMAIAAYTSAGILDTTFGTGGLVTFTIGNVTQAYAGLIQTNGDILAGGSSDNSAALVRLTSAGVFDQTWGFNGIVTTPGGSSSGVTTIIFDQKASGTNGGTFTFGAWQTRNLNTIIGTSSDVTLGTNQIILQPGTYQIEVSAPAYKVGSHQIRLQDVTDGITFASGSTSSSNTTNPSITNSLINSKVFVTKVTNCEIQHQCQATEANDGFGLAAGFGNEVYTIVKIVEE